MTNTSKFFERLGKLIPGFSGYYNRESLRENDYQLRLHIKQKIENLVHEIERSKTSLDDNILLEMDKVQNNLKLFSVKISNQSYGYSAMFDKVNSENDMREDRLNSLIEKNPKKRYIANINPKNKNSINFFKASIANEYEKK